MSTASFAVAGLLIIALRIASIFAGEEGGYLSRGTAIATGIAISVILILVVWYVIFRKSVVRSLRLKKMFPDEDVWAIAVRKKTKVTLKSLLPEAASTIDESGSYYNVIVALDGLNIWFGNGTPALLISVPWANVRDVQQVKRETEYGSELALQLELKSGALPPLFFNKQGRLMPTNLSSDRLRTIENRIRLLAQLPG